MDMQVAYRQVFWLVHDQWYATSPSHESSNGLQPSSDRLQATSNGLQPTSDKLPVPSL